MSALKQAVDDVMQHQWSNSREAMAALKRLLDAADEAENEVINLRSRMETLNKNLQELRGAAEFAAQRLEHARTWEGGDWHYSPLHPVHYRSALTRIRCALKGIV